MYYIYRRQYWAGIKQWAEYPMLKSGRFAYKPDEIQTFVTQAEAQFIINNFPKDEYKYEVRLCKQ